MTSGSPAGDCVDMRRSPQKDRRPAPMTRAKIRGERPCSRRHHSRNLHFLTQAATFQTESIGWVIISPATYDAYRGASVSREWHVDTLSVPRRANLFHLAVIQL